MVTSLDVKQGSENSTHVKYTVSFDGTNHINYGEFDASPDETTTAFKGATTKDMWKGFRDLVLTRLVDEATNSLKKGDDSNAE